MLVRVNGYFLMHGVCYLSPKASFHCQGNRILDQESVSFSNCELILYCNRVSEANRQRFSLKENNWFKILPRIRTVFDPKKCSGRREVTGLLCSCLTWLKRCKLQGFLHSGTTGEVSFHGLLQLQQAHGQRLLGAR